MAHEITKTINGTEFASYKQPAWHGLGQVFQDQITLTQGIEMANLNWEVGILPNIHRWPDGTEIVSEDSFFTYRQDNNFVLGPALGKSYRVIQHTEAFQVIDAVLSDGHHLETAGSIKGGKIVFAVVKMDQSLFIDTEEHTDLYMVFMCSHDGKMSTKVFLTPVRVVCWNTLQMSLRSVKYEISIRHTGDTSGKIQEAANIIDTFRDSAKRAEEYYDRMMNHKFRPQDFFNYIGNVFMDAELIQEAKEVGQKAFSTQKVNLLKEVITYAIDGPGQDGGRTAWGAYNAVTGYYANNYNWKDADQRFWGLTKGSQANVMKTALDLAANPKKITNIAREVSLATAN